MQIKHLLLISGVLSIGLLAGCSNNSNNEIATPANAMPLVKTGAGSVSTSGRAAGNNVNIYNANTANASSVAKEDSSKVQYMPSDYSDLGSNNPTKGTISVNATSTTDTSKANHKK